MQGIRKIGMTPAREGSTDSFKFDSLPPMHFMLII